MLLTDVTHSNNGSTTDGFYMTLQLVFWLKPWALSEALGQSFRW